MSAEQGVDVLRQLPAEQKAVVRRLDVIRARLKIDHALSDSDAEIWRCVEPCSCPESLVKIAIVARDYGLHLVGHEADAAAERNFERNIWIPGSLEHEYAAADALDLFSALRDMQGADDRNIGEEKGAVATRRESAQTMAHGSSADSVSIQLPLFSTSSRSAAALARIGGAQ